MSHDLKESDALTHFTADPTPFLERLRRSGKPILLTVHGQPELIVQDAASYLRFLEEVERLETMAAVKEGLQDVAAGRTRPMRQALEEIAQKYDLAADGN